MPTPDEGWVALPSKYHFVRMGRTLCRRWKYYGSIFFNDKLVNQRECCKNCFKRREEEAGIK